MLNYPAPSKPVSYEANNGYSILSYKQAQVAVNEALPILYKLGVGTKRPEDYFAEMVKTDDHMQRVNWKIILRCIVLKNDWLKGKWLTCHPANFENIPLQGNKHKLFKMPSELTFYFQRWLICNCGTL